MKAKNIHLKHLRNEEYYQFFVRFRGRTMQTEKNAQ